MGLINEIYIYVDLLLPGQSYENMGKLIWNLLLTSNKTTNKAEQIHVFIFGDIYIFNGTFGIINTLSFKVG